MRNNKEHFSSLTDFAELILFTATPPPLLSLIIIYG